MKSIKPILLAATLCALTLLSSCKKSGSDDSPEETSALTPPVETWQEHWFQHTQLVKRVYYDDKVAVYDDPYMSTIRHEWINKTMGDVWTYVKKNYGQFGNGDPRLYVVTHGVIGNLNSSYSGGHPDSYFGANHDYRNMIDVGLGADSWTSETGQAIGIMTHEVGHIVCGANNGVNGSPSDALWGDSKFMEIFNYDVFANINRQSEADLVYSQMQTQYDNFPQAGTQWFKNWFYPIYTNYGRGAVLSKYFQLLAANFPSVNKLYARDINLGEFVHFWSGAAGVNLEARALLAFGASWSNETTQAQFRIAKVAFPNVKYTN
ncbi:hypothetical protein LPB86_19735 [Pedobacter sp. MC2016-14]|uniref:hypothetical protein n=1 Tax=Pedobacter sp. MC2016-14 TaxID=2897327 RepID=UPI001E4D2BE5|nr:hypothetical protein [Pedobacter sp. MC2016-14]MCD0490480.1 hypothetical protein [Pedobacter sp. MC2016-14]